MGVRQLFEKELLRRGLHFSIDPDSGRHAVEIGGGRMLVCLDNLERDVTRDADADRISSFVDAIEAAPGSDDELSADRLYWCLEPADYDQPADFRVKLSDQVERVLVHLSADGRLATWVTPQMLEDLRLVEVDAGAKAFSNIVLALREAKVETGDNEGVELGFIGTPLPFKSAFILAPNLREVVGNLLGWPLLAVVPDRDFLYLWAAKHTDFVQRVGSVVVREYSQASYPISTEVYEITDQQIRAIGKFPRGD